MENMEDLIERAKMVGTKIVAVAAAADADVLLAVEAARKFNLINGILVGDEYKIKSIAKDCCIDVSSYIIVNEKDANQAVNIAARYVSEGKADIIMKGLVDSSVYLGTILKEEYNLRTGNILSSVGVIDIASYNKLFLISDSGMNIAPDLKTKVNIINNAVLVATRLGCEMPKVAIVCPKEKVDHKIQSTIDAQQLEQMNREGKIVNCIVAGPVSYDIAMSAKAAEHKGYRNAIAGDADILILPNLDAGNILYKSYVHSSEAKTAGTVVGAKVPIIFTSRADSDETKLYSIALAVLLS